ncbi:UNVERIFIED_CONTAM: hypothetical protein K2H54_054901, partial [Gekko kuhli]
EKVCCGVFTWLASCSVTGHLVLNGCHIQSGKDKIPMKSQKSNPHSDYWHAIMLIVPPFFSFYWVVLKDRHFSPSFPFSHTSKYISPFFFLMGSVFYKQSQSIL